MAVHFERVSDTKRLQFITQALANSLPAGAAVLDVGCGNGIITQHVGALGYPVLGIDISEKTIQKAKASNTLANVQFQVMSAEELKASGQKYGAVICSEVLEHLHQPHLLLEQLYGCLADDGILIVTVPNGNGPRELFVTRPVQAMKAQDNWLWHAISKMKSVLGYGGTTVQSSADDLTHIQFFTKTDIEDLAKRSRFKVVRFGKTNFVEDVFPFSLLTKRIPFLQRLDCALASVLPIRMNGGFVMVWTKNQQL